MKVGSRNLESKFDGVYARFEAVSGRFETYVEQVPKSHPRPARWIKNERDFGNVERAPFRDDEARDEVDRGRLAAAKIQHLFARVVRVEANALGIPIPALAARLDFKNEENLRRLLRGDAQMSAVHMHALAAILDIEIKVDIEGARVSYQDL